MFGERKSEARIISCTKEVVENMPAMGGANPLLEAAAIQDESKSMWMHDTFYRVTFQVGDKKKEVKVNRLVYDRLKEGDKGTLCYSGKNFISFEKDNIL